jgi:hypothetical protein
VFLIKDNQELMDKREAKSKVVLKNWLTHKTKKFTTIKPSKVKYYLRVFCKTQRHTNIVARLPILYAHSIFLIGSPSILVRTPIDSVGVEFKMVRRA